MPTDLGHGVAAHVYPHQLRGIDCTSHVTDGLRAFGQAELVITMSDGPDPTALLRTIVGCAEQGTIVTEGGFSETGFTFQRAWPMNGVVLPDGTLAMVALVGAEMEAAKAFGSLRVLARLGQAFEYFPTAVWCDVHRGAASEIETDTVLAEIALAHGGNSTIVDTGTELVLSIPRSEQPMLASILTNPDMPFGLTMSLDPTADSCLVWQPGQAGPSAITLLPTKAERLSGCFAAFIPDQAADEYRMMEDGFAFLLTEQTWQRLRLALSTCAPASVPFDQRTLTLTWTWP